MEKNKEAFMRRLLIVLVLAFQSSAAFPASGDTTLSFDQGVQFSPPLAPISLEPKTNGMRALSGGFVDAILNHAGYIEASGYLPRIRQLPPETNAPLLESWDDINTTRGTLLEKARGLEIQRDKIVKDGNDLDDEAAALVKQRDAYNKAASDYNNQCAGQPVNSYCQDWLARLGRAKTALQNQIADHNLRFAAWQNRVKDFNVVANAHNAARAQWGNQIGAFISAAKKALESQCRKLDKPEIRPQALQRVPTGGVQIPYEVIAYFEREPVGAPPCPTNFYWTLEPHPDHPNGWIGAISPRSGRTTTFKSGSDTGTGTIVCQDLNSGKGTGANVDLYNPAAH
jgi:hypothetical protein